MDPLSKARYKGPSHGADQLPSFPYLLLPHLETGFVAKGVRQPVGLYAEEKKPSVFDPPEDPSKKKKKAKSPTRPAVPAAANQKPLVLATTAATPPGFYGPGWKAENPIDKTFRAAKRPKPLLQLSDGTKLTPERLKERTLGYDAIAEAKELATGDKPPVYKNEFHKPVQLATHKGTKVAGAPGWAPAQVAKAIEAAEREEQELQEEADSEARQQWEELVAKHQREHNERRELVASRQPGASRGSSRKGRSMASPRSEAATTLLNGLAANESKDDNALSDSAALIASYSLRGEDIPQHLLEVAERARTASPPADAPPLLPREVVAAHTGYLPQAPGTPLPTQGAGSVLDGSSASVLSGTSRSAFAASVAPVEPPPPAKDLQDLASISGSSAARGAGPGNPLSVLSGRSNSPPGTARQPTAATFQTTLNQEEFAVLKHGLKSYSAEVLAFKRRKNRGNVMREVSLGSRYVVYPDLVLPFLSFLLPISSHAGSRSPFCRRTDAHSKVVARICCSMESLA
jgi:hypothetical protein